MRKYIHLAKGVKPKLTPEASEAIADEHSKLRSQDMMDSDVARVYFIYNIYVEFLLKRDL
jgi:DNA replication licensing factor MCM3